MIVGSLYMMWSLQAERERLADAKKRKAENEKKNEIVVPVSWLQASLGSLMLDCWLAAVTVLGLARCPRTGVLY